MDDETLFDFYDQRLPDDVVSARHFDAWWKKARRAEPELLNFERSMLINEGRGGVDQADYPDHWRQGDLDLALSYQFEPGTAADGVTVHVPVAVLPRLAADEFTWQVPGLRRDLVTALIRSLPKATRRNFVPAPDYAAALLAELPAREGPLLAALERGLRRYTGVAVARHEWDLARVPDHLKVTFRVVDDESGKPLAEGKDLVALQEELKPKVRETLAETTGALARTGLNDLGFRYAAAHRLADPGRLRGHRLPDAGRRGRQRRRTGRGDRARAADAHVAGHPPAAAPDGPAAAEGGPGPAVERGPAGAEPQPAPRRAGAAGRLRDGDPRRAHRRARRAGVGRGGLRGAA